MLKQVGLLFLLCLPFVSFSQVDTEFWFAPPEITSGHGDRPIFLRISTLAEAANVRVLQPARGNVTLANVNVPANTTHTLNLTSSINSLETEIPATVLKTGIRILSSAPITAYYEVGATWNTDIFSLKGKNALGNSFVIPVQNTYDNGSYFPTPYFSFDIVATRNNTVVKVRPTKPIVGHESTTEITIKLNAGETYSFRKTSTLASANPGGTVVESNKPIAITLKDDSVINGGCRDVLGDQLVPIEVAGSEYVVLKGFLQSTEYLFITAIHDETKVFVNGSVAPVATLQAGGLYRLTITNPSTHVMSDKTIYAMHVTGFGCEMGMAILPSINCKGSAQIGFARTTTEFFGLNVLVRKEGINSFTLNGSSTLVPASSFKAVPGTGDQWYAAQLSYNTSQIPVNSASLISNSVNSFQIGIINGDAATSCRYGYFSAFSTLFIGDDFNMCEGETVSLDAGPGKESYLWNTGSTDQQIEITQPGTYWVKAEKEECVLYDSITVNVKKGKIELGPDVIMCKDDTTEIDGHENFSWQWSDGSTERYLKTTVPGKYWVSVFDYTGCQASDTINVSTKPLPVFNLGPDIIKCPHEEITLDAVTVGATYVWQDGSTATSKTTKDSGVYWCKVTVNGCTAIDSVVVENLPGPQQDTILGSPSVCPYVTEVEYRVDESANTIYQWFVNGGTVVYNDGPAIHVDWEEANPAAMVKALLTDADGCKSDTLYFPVRVNPELIVELPIGPDTLCANKRSDVLYTTPNTNGSVYNWIITGGEVVSGQGTSEAVINWNLGLNSLRIEETSLTIDTVCTGISDNFQVYVFQDEAGVIMNSVSVDTVDESTLNVRWTVQHPERVKDNKVYLYKSITGQNNWSIVTQVSGGITSFKDTGNSPDENGYTYYVSLSNLCDEELFSFEHSSMRLTGQSDTVENIIYLTWSHYMGWTEGVDHYEVYRKLDDSPGYKKIMEINSAENDFQVTTRSGFDHQYLIRAIEKSGSDESWSNSINFSFEHELHVPNVFTPNGDPQNQFFEITNIGLYKDSHLRVMNRWGKTVFEAKGYGNDWDGDDLDTGVYFYVLKFRNKMLKGTLSVLR